MQNFNKFGIDIHSLGIKGSRCWWLMRAQTRIKVADVPPAR